MGARTGEQFLRALRDGRQVWHAGRRIADVAAQPGLAGPAGTLARLYDRQHQPETRDVMTVEWQGERISWSYLPPTTPQELAARRRNTEFWSRETLGQMGRFPDFCAAFTLGLLDAAEWLGQAGDRFAHNARAYHRWCAERDLCLTHALNDQFYDRSRRVADQPDPDLILHVVRETEDGPIVRGLRSLATLAPLSDEVLVHPNRPREADEADYSIAFALPMNAPGLTTICRDLYAEHADPERLPLSARFDEIDANLFFDDVLVPWERVFVYRNPALGAQYHGRISLWSAYSTLERLLCKLEVFVGVADLLTTWSGRGKDRTAQERLGQLMADVEVLRACVQAAEANAYRTQSGLLAPRMNDAYRLHGIEASDRAIRLLQELLTSSLVLTGGASDLETEIGPLVERFWRGGAPSTREHLRFLAIAADLALSAFAGRNQLYERLQSGEPDNMRRRFVARFERSEMVDRLRRFVAEEMENGRQAPVGAGLKPAPTTGPGLEPAPTAVE